MHNIVPRRTILRLLGGSAALALLPVHGLADTLDGDTFRQNVIVLLKRRHPEWQVVPGTDPETIKISNFEIYLDNIYRQVRNLPSAERDDQTVSFIENALTESEKSKDNPGFAEAGDRVRPQIVPADYLGQAPDLVHRPFLAGLMVAYAIDEKNRYELLRQPDIDAWQIGQAEIETHAIANLEAASTGLAVQLGTNPQGGAFIAVSTSDGYDAARLLLPQFMRRLRQAMKASLVFVGIPSRDFLVTWTPDFASRRAFATKIAQDFRDRPHPLTDALFASSDSGVRLADAAAMRDHGR